MRVIGGKLFFVFSLTIFISKVSTLEELEEEYMGHFPVRRGQQEEITNEWPETVNETYRERVCETAFPNLTIISTQRLTATLRIGIYGQKNEMIICNEEEDRHYLVRAGERKVYEAERHEEGDYKLAIRAAIIHRVSITAIRKEEEERAKNDSDSD